MKEPAEASGNYSIDVLPVVSFKCNSLAHTLLHDCLMKYFFLFCFLLLFTTRRLYAQHSDMNILDSLGGKIISQIQALDNNKIWLVTDRDIYAAGEAIYYKAWLVDSIRNHILKSPKKLYVDLVDDKDKIIRQSLLNNATLETNGNLPLSELLPGGNYWLRAYTTAETNMNAAPMSTVPLYIVNLRLPDTSAPIARENTDKNNIVKPSIHWFAEGGSIISGLPSTLAIQAVDGNGKPWMISGTLKDNHDTTVALFTTNAQGLAKLSFYPKWFNRYSLHIRNNNQKDSVIALLPPVNFFAAQMSSVQQTNDYLTARVALEDSLLKRDAATYLIGISKDSLCFAAKGNGIYTATIPTASFPGGVARLLLFNEKQQLLSERDVYIHKQDVNIIITADKESYAGRENVQLSIQVKDGGNQPLLSSLTVAVTDDRIEDSSARTLNEDTLAGLSAADVDLVMLTRQKSETTPIPASLSEANKKIKTDDSSFTISGKVVNKKGELVSKHIVTVLSAKKIFFVQTDTTNTNGAFRFSLPDFSDSTEFSFQINNSRGRKDDEDHIVFDTAAMPDIATPAYLKRKVVQPRFLQTARIAFLNTSAFTAGFGKDYLKPITVTTFKKKELTYDASKRVSNFSHIITQDMIGAGADMAGNALLMIPGVHLSQGLIMIGGPGDFRPSARNEPLIIMDGARVDLNANDSTTSSPVLNFLNAISFRTIDFIEVLTGADAAIYGLNGGNGVILINTKAGGQGLINSKGLQAYFPQGFSVAKLFPMPDYNKASVKKSKAADSRITLYWKGNIYTDKEGKATINFFSADAATTYVATVTAVTANGCVLQKKVRIGRQ